VPDAPEKPNIETHVTEEANALTATSTIGETRNPPTQEQVVEASNVDLDLWEPDKFEYHSREVTKKDPVTGEEAIVSLFRADLRCKRKIAVTTELPTIQPVSISVTPLTVRQKQPMGRKSEQAVILSDYQMGYSRDIRSGKLTPYHDRTIWDIATQVIGDLKPALIVLNGDMVDIPEFTGKFPRTSDQYFTMQPTLVEMKWLLTRLRYQAPIARIVWIEGNHEQRLPNFVRDQIIAAHGLQQVDSDHSVMSLPHLLKLDELGVEFLDDYPNNQLWPNENVRVIHGNKSLNKPGQTALAYIEDSKTSTVFGHTHRAESVSKTFYHHDGPKEYQSASFGHMGHTDRIPAKEKKHNWQRGFGVLEYIPGNGPFNIMPVEVRHGDAFWLSYIYEGKDYVDELRKDTDWESF
jgi:hypothetical protein